MNEQYIGERVNDLDVDERIYPVIENTSPVVDQMPMVDHRPVDAEYIHEEPTDEPITHENETPGTTNTDSSTTLLNREDAEHFRTKWNVIQGNFVDEPRTAVQQADALVSDVIGQITQMFSEEHSSLESQWHQGNDVSTEDLRKALQRYRSFFNRLVV